MICYLSSLNIKYNIYLIYQDNNMYPRLQRWPQPSLQQFNFQKQLGKGAYGSVSKYVHKKTLLPYAIKQISLLQKAEANIPSRKKQQKDLLMIKNQIQILYKVKSRYIVQLIDHFVREQQNKVYLIMQYIQGKDLHKSIFIKKTQLAIKEIATIIYQMGLALAQLHKHNIIHRDLKLENVIYLPNKTIKLIDLGCSNYYGENQSRFTKIGTSFYLSPELLASDGQDDKLDIWALGVILYQLLFLQSPFSGANIIVKIRKFQYQIPQPYKSDHQLVDLFNKIFTHKQKRIKAKQLINHKWIQKHYNPKIIQQLDIQSQIIDKEEMKRYKQFLLQQIQKCQQDIQKIRDDNQKLRKMQHDQDDIWMV